MNQVVFDRPAGMIQSNCTDLTALAERELSAFFNAVKEVFGSEQAELSAEDWLHELNTSKDLPSSERQWRLITTRGSTRLASRVNGLSFPVVSKSVEETSEHFSWLEHFVDIDCPASSAQTQQRQGGFQHSLR